MRGLLYSPPVQPRLDLYPTPRSPVQRGRDPDLSVLIDVVRTFQRVDNGLNGNFHDQGYSFQ